MAASGSNSSRALLEKGLARYGRGQIDEALAAWREALVMDPGNEEARKLVSFVEERLVHNTAGDPRETAEMATMRDTTPTTPARDTAAQKAADADYERGDTNPELDRTTDETLPTAESPDDEAAGPRRKRRDTLVSGIPAILAKSTKPGVRSTPVPPHRAISDEQRARHEASTPVPPRSGPPDVSHVEEFGKVTTRSSFAPVPTDTRFPPATPEPAVDSITRPIGAERTPLPKPSDRTAHARPTQTFRTDTPLDLALATARTRAAVLVDQCRRSLDAGKVSQAAAAAEEALEEGDKAPMPGIAEVIEPARAMFSQAFEMHVGPEVGVPTMAVDVSAAGAAAFDHRTGFLLSCIDGTLPVQTLLDIAGMGRFDSLRTLSGLLRRGIIKF